MMESRSVITEGDLYRHLSRLSDPMCHMTAMKSPRGFIALLILT